jgi:hypothetical protein
MNDDLPRSRREAKALGVRRFYCGPCEVGHDAPRYASSGECVTCSDLRARPMAAFQRRLQRVVVAHLGVPVETLMRLPEEELSAVLAEHRLIGTETFRGDPCPYHDGAFRYRSNRQCVECKRAMNGRRHYVPKKARLTATAPDSDPIPAQ